MTRYAFMAGLFFLMSGGMAAAHAASAPGANDAGRAPYVSGGIGEAEQRQIKARESEFNLKLVFTLVEGNYLADVDVEIKNSAGKTVIHDVAGGPFFLVKLPAGQYTVAATYEGKTLTRKLRVGSKGLGTEYLRWPSNPATDLPLSREQAEESKPAVQPKRG